MTAPGPPGSPDPGPRRDRTRRRTACATPTGPPRWPAPGAGGRRARTACARRRSARTASTASRRPPARRGPRAPSVAGAPVAGATPVVTITLVAVNVVVFVLTALSAGSAWANYTSPWVEATWLVPADVAAGQWWRLVTAGFLHIGPLHVAVNMFALWVLGRDLELVLGRLRYALLYGVSLLGGIDGDHAVRRPRPARRRRLRGGVRPDGRAGRRPAPTPALADARAADHRDQRRADLHDPGPVGARAPRRARHRPARRRRARARPGAVTTRGPGSGPSAGSPPCSSSSSLLRVLTL